jgi:spermidine synthase
MVPWKLLDRAAVPHGSAELLLYQRGSEFSIRVGSVELMNSRVHASEDALAERVCARLGNPERARVLVGGLGMGFTLSAALRATGPTAEVVAAELVPKVVAWNRDVLGHLAGHPLRDPRVQVRQIDVAELLRQQTGGYDAILLDVDNGPEGLGRARNDWLYGSVGLRTCFAALREHGMLGVWSASLAPAFGARMRVAGFAVQQVTARARAGLGSRHRIFIGSRTRVRP